MHFLRLAHNALERGDTARAIILLIGGLKRHPEQEDALALLLELYGDTCVSPGLEQDIVALLREHAEGGWLLSALMERFEARALPQMASQLERVAAQAGLQVAALPAPWLALIQADAASAATLDDADALDDPDASAEPAPTRPARIATVTSGRAARSAREAQPRAPQADAQLAAEPAPRQRRRLSRVSGALLALAICAGLGWTLWLGPEREDEALARQLERLDPLNPAPFERALARASERFGANAQTSRQRALFLQAALALSHPEGAPLPTETPDESAWGRGARVFIALHGRDMERALGELTALEFAAPQALPTLWARAWLEEERGRYAQARQRYTLALARFPDFLPGALGLARVAMRLGDAEALTQALSRVEALNPSHPYLALRDAQALSAQELVRLSRAGSATPPLKLEARDRFLSAYERYVQAMAAWRRGDGAAASQAATQALDLEPGLGPALLLRALWQAQHAPSEAAVASLMALASLEGQSATARLTLMSAAPVALTQAGRPDLALAFALDEGIEGGMRQLIEGLSERERASWRAARVPALSLSPQEIQAAGPLAGVALTSLAYTLWEWGKSEEALTALNRLEDLGLATPQSRLLRVAAQLRLGRRGETQGALRALQGEVALEVARAMISLMERRDVEAAEVMRAVPIAQWPGPVAARVGMNAALATQRPHEALELLQHQPWSPLYEVLTQRQALRARAMQGAQNEAYLALAERVPTQDLTSVSALLDLAWASFWQGDGEAALARVEGALERAPEALEAHLCAGLVLRQLGRHDRAREHLARVAGASAEDDPLLSYQLGLVYLELGRDEEAHRALYRTILADRAHLGALRGLGQLFARGDRALGKREFTRFLIGYEGQSRWRAQRGEVLKWLAVFHGSREGAAEGLYFLQRAEKEIGRRPDLLVEQGRYSVASGKGEAARASFIEALRGDTSMAAAHHGLAKLALEASETSLALDHLKKFLELEPHGAQARWARERLAALAPPARP